MEEVQWYEVGGLDSERWSEWEEKCCTEKG